jgi:hypothetical protein
MADRGQTGGIGYSRGGRWAAWLDVAVICRDHGHQRRQGAPAAWAGCCAQGEFHLVAAWERVPIRQIIGRSGRFG